MVTIKKANTGKLIKGAINAVTSSKKVTIPPGLKKSIARSQRGPTKITPYSSEAERIAAGGPTNLQKNKTVNRFDPNYEKPYKPKKQPKVDKYGFDTRPDRNGGMHKKKMKNGGSLSGLIASNKRDKGTDVGGAWTKVQNKTLAGARGKAKLTKDKQLGATKMAKRGMSIKKK
jgi:hypothetical protein